MRITAKGQVTIPIKIRTKAGLMPNTDVDFEFDGPDVRIFPSNRRTGVGRGALWLNCGEPEMAP